RRTPPSLEKVYAHRPSYRMAGTLRPRPRRRWGPAHGSTVPREVLRCDSDACRHGLCRVRLHDPDAAQGVSPPGPRRRSFPPLLSWIDSAPTDRGDRVAEDGTRLESSLSSA